VNQGSAALPRSALAALFFAVFVVALGFGVILPILPLMVERLLVSPDPVGVARHTALLTAAFAVAPLATALPWGRLSDRYGRRPILVLGLGGFSLTLAVSPLATDLPILYVARLLNGGFAAAVLPTALALVADTEVDEARRARTFGWVTIAFSLGLLGGPMLGGFASGLDATALGRTVPSYPQAFPFLLVASTAVVAVVAVMRYVQRGSPPQGQQARLRSPARGGEIRLLVLAAIVAGGLGAFEVGLALRSRDLTIAPQMLGLIFAACMVVMLIVQAIAFSPLVKPATTRWLVAPSFAGMGLGLALTSIATGSIGLMSATALVAAAGGLLTPVLAYWVSLISGRGQGTELGLQTAAVSLGQTLGAVSAGLLFEFSDIFGPSLLVPGAMAIAAAIALTLPARLAPEAELVRR